MLRLMWDMALNRLFAFITPSSIINDKQIIFHEMLDIATFSSKKIQTRDFSFFRSVTRFKGGSKI